MGQSWVVQRQNANANGRGVLLGAEGRAEGRRWGEKEWNAIGLLPWETECVQLGFALFGNLCGDIFATQKTQQDSQ